ncbi:MAG: glycosyltransferase family 4 protein [Bacteroidetes bacterium]|nr:glycosyltransferase family 4 protein [Bacteroidota bacterium]
MTDNREIYKSWYSKKDLIQVTMHYHPFRSGGQQLYVEELRGITTEMGLLSSVIQPMRGGEPPEWVVEIAPMRGLRKISPHASWFWFTYRLRSRWAWIDNASVVVVHYPFHVTGLSSSSRKIILSHGVDWPERPVKLVDRYKKWVAEYCKQKGMPTVANDTDYFRRIGMDVPVGQPPYSMVAQNSWYIPNAVDTDFMRDEKGKRKPVVLVPRNIRKSRGIHLAIEAFWHFHKRNPSFEMWIAGGQTRGLYYELCHDLVKDYSLQNHVRFLGEVEHAQMNSLYQEAMVTLIPTLAFEGTSYSALEAMACGSATLSTNVGGLADLPTEKTDIEAVAVAERLEEMLEGRTNIVERQRALVERDFDIRQWRAAWRRVIEWRMSLPS